VDLINSIGYYYKVNKDKGILGDFLEIGSLGGDCCLRAIVDRVVTSSLGAGN